MLSTKAILVAGLSPPCDPPLAERLVDEFVSLERRFVQRDWEPAELDGGQFCEILARLLVQLDGGGLRHTWDHGDCLKHLRDEAGRHTITPRSTPLHMCKVLDAVYKFRSARGAVHISSTYEPNEMDARFVLESVRWLFAETLRVWWNSDREKVAAIIRELIQFDVPCIGEYGGRKLVQRTDLSTEEELLLLLHAGGDGGVSRSDLGAQCLRASSSITEALGRLSDAKQREAVRLANGRFRLTDLGTKRIREELATKLVLAC